VSCYCRPYRSRIPRPLLLLNAPPTLFLLSQDELPPGFVRQANRDEDLTTPTWSHASRVYWRFNPEIGPDDITSLHMGITVYDSPGQASAGLASLYPELLRNFELVESTSDVGEEAVRMWHSIAQPGVRQAEAWYILFRVGPVVARSRWGDFDDLPNHEGCALTYCVLGAVAMSESCFPGMLGSGTTVLDESFLLELDGGRRFGSRRPKSRVGRWGRSCWR